MYLAVERSTADPKFPSASSAVQHMPELANAGGNKKSYDTIFELPNKAKSGPLEAAGSSVQLCPVLAGPSGCWQRCPALLIIGHDIHVFLMYVVPLVLWTGAELVN